MSAAVKRKVAAAGEMGETTILMNTGELILNCEDKKVPIVIFV